MARKFPHAAVVGVDVAPVPMEPETVPPNCQFEIDDIELGLTHFQNPPNQFDLIHARSIIVGLKDFRRSLADIQNCLKPGGVLIWIEPDYEWFTPDIHVYRALGSDANPMGSWMGRIAYGTCFRFPSCLIAGMGMESGSILMEYMAEATRAGSRVGQSDFAGMAQVLDEGLWEEPLLDPET